MGHYYIINDFSPTFRRQHKIHTSLKIKHLSDISTYIFLRITP